MRARFAGLLGAAIIAASCGSPSATPSSPTPTAAATISPAPTVGPGASPSPGQTATPTASPDPAAEGRWETTGQMSLARGIPHAVLLGDGTVMVVGNDGDGGCVRADSVQSETWDPATGAWSAGPSLNAPRADFAAAPVAGGGVLVTGGVTAGVTEDQVGHQDKHQSYSSTYVSDPQTEPAGWSRAGLLDRARTLPSAATLLDGRVLVAGGYYLDGRESGAAPASGIQLASYHASPGGSTPGARTFGDMAPPHIAPTWATAELYDPATGSWSGTGPLRYARVGAPAVTLVDGQVLVVGSVREWAQGGWNYSQPAVDGRAYETAEIYDPRSGRFSLTGDLPAVDWSPLATWGPYPVSSYGVLSPGALVALADGGALLVGEVTEWAVGAVGRSGTMVRTMRFDPGGSWAVIDERVQASNPDDPTAPIEVLVDGHARGDSRAVQLRDGRVLIAGGRVPTGEYQTTPSSTADLYDPATNTWLELPPMPGPRAGGAAVLLDDGSVLVVGGDDGRPTCAHEFCDCGEGSTGTASAVRFIPGP